MDPRRQGERGGGKPHSLLSAAFLHVNEVSELTLEWKIYVRVSDINNIPTILRVQ